jgi:outer membrane protein TolC
MRPAVLACLLAGFTATATAAQSLTLAETIQRAQQLGAPARLAGSDLARADAQRSVASAALLPRLELQAFQTRRTTNLKAQGIEFPGLPALAGPYDTFDARVTLSQSLFDARALLAKRGANLGTDIARAQAAAAQEQAATRATLGYIAVLRAEQAVAAAESDAQLARELLTLAQDQRRAGVASGVDVARAETLVSQDEFALVQARTTLTAATIALKRIAALPQDGEVSLADGLAFQPQPLPQAGAAVQEALTQRKELEALTLQREVRAVEKDAARARRLPSAGLFADYGVSANTPGENDEDTYTVGARIGMPIFSGGAIAADIRSAQAGLDEAAIRLEDAQAEVEQDVRIALAQAGSTAEQVRAAEATRGLAERELTLARDRFAHGVGSNIEVVEAQAALARARAGAIDALASAQVARANFAAALGNATEFHLPPATPAQSPE